MIIFDKRNRNNNRTTTRLLKQNLTNNNTSKYKALKQVVEDESCRLCDKKDDQYHIYECKSSKELLKTMESDIQVICKKTSSNLVIAPFWLGYKEALDILRNTKPIGAVKNTKAYLRKKFLAGKGYFPAKVVKEVNKVLKHKPCMKLCKDINEIIVIAMWNIDINRNKALQNKIFNYKNNFQRFNIEPD